MLDSMVQQQISSSCIGTTRLSWLSGAVLLTRPAEPWQRERKTKTALRCDFSFKSLGVLLFPTFPAPPNSGDFWSCPASEASVWEAHIGKSSCCCGPQWSLWVSPKDSRTLSTRKREKPINRRKTSENAPKIVKADVCLLWLCLQSPGWRQSLRSNGQEVSGNTFVSLSSCYYFDGFRFFSFLGFSSHHKSFLNTNYHRVVVQLCSLLVARPS